MTLMFSTVDCCLEHATYSESQSLEDASASCTLKCAWGDRYELVEDLLDNRRPWPYRPGLTAKTAAIDPLPGAFTVDGQGMQYVEALVKVAYGPQVVSETEGSSESSGDRAYDDENPAEHEAPITDLMSESFEPSAEFLTLDPKRFRWNAADGDALLEGEAPGMLQLGTILVRTLYQVDVVPTKAVDSTGKVNDGNYTSKLLGVSFAPETLLYLPPSAERTLRSDGSGTWTLTMRFSYKPNGWNKYWRAATQTWQKIYIAGGGEYRSYPKGNFSGLLF